MTKTLPIKDVNIIKNIKELYIKKNNIRDLLLFLLSINTGMSLHDLLNLNIKDVKDKYYCYPYPLSLISMPQDTSSQSNTCQAAPCHSTH